MPRIARLQSDSGYYHIMQRGINRQDIFEDNEDRERYLKTLFRFAEETGDSIAAWCLMNNHVHLLIKSERLPDMLIKKTGCSYVPYYNKKYGRIGHLFQDRYKSEPVGDEAYLLAVVRYIHRNPEKAGLCRMEDYAWSSYNDYITASGKTETAAILDYFKDIEDFQTFMKTEDNTEFLEDDVRLSEKEAAAIAAEIIPESLFYLQKCPKNERDLLINRLSQQGLTAAQICRITGLGSKIVYLALRKNKIRQ